LQHIVAGLEEFMKSKDSEEIVRSGIKIRLNIMQDKYNIGGDNYLANWVNYISNDSKISNVNIEVYYTNFSDNHRIDEEISKICKNGYADIIFIGNILSEIKTVFEKGEKQFNSLYEIKFPMIYKPILTQEKIRKVEISQHQFEAATLHAQLCYKISNDHIDTGYEDKLLYRELDFTKKSRDLINEAHKKGRWILCLDKSIDKELLMHEDNENKIISFTTGEGPFGEYNITLSTNFRNLDEFKRKLKIKLRDFLDTEYLIEKASKKILKYSNKIEGITLLKAINLSDRQINKYLTYIMLNEYLNMENNLNKILINLDAYSHWFNTGEKSPDYLLVELQEENGELVFIGTIIECKLGKENHEETRSAEEQIKSGYNRLKTIFNPELLTTESRYWNSQLYRVLIYSLHEKLSKDTNNSEVNLEILKKILSGKYKFSWKGETLYFLTNINSNQLTNLETKIIDGLEIFENKIGKDKIIELLALEIGTDGVPIQPNEPTPTEEPIQPNEPAPTEEPIRPSELAPTEEPVPTDNEILTLLKFVHQKSNVNDIEEEKKYAETQLKKLLEKLRTASKLSVSPYQKGFDIGPNFIRMKLVPEGTTKVNNIKNAYDDIKVWLALKETPYIFADAGYISIDIPRLKPATIHFANILENIYKEKLIDNDGLKFMIGVDELYKPVIVDMQDSKDPHMLIAGQSGSGKSVLINCIILNVMLNHTPEQVKMLLIDPKKVELSPFKDSQFLYKPIIKEINLAIEALTQLVEEMDKRYNKFSEIGVKDLKGYNKKQEKSDSHLARILVVFDEFGDFMAQDKKSASEIENRIIRLAQKGRAAGIHLIIATQSPKAEIITTTIKNNLPSRVALSVTDTTASQVVLDQSGAENLYGKGDLLFKGLDYKTPKRLRSAFIDEENQELLLEKIEEYHKKR
ncbi:MAG: FtsK/SpoIIIE domain-containing protein, partial [Fusobacteriaceae bacterium]